MVSVTTGPGGVAVVRAAVWDPAWAVARDADWADAAWVVALALNSARYDNQFRIELMSASHPGSRAFLMAPLRTPLPAVRGAGGVGLSQFPTKGFPLAPECREMV